MQQLYLLKYCYTNIVKFAEVHMVLSTTSMTPDWYNYILFINSQFSFVLLWINWSVHFLQYRRFEKKPAYSNLSYLNNFNINVLYDIMYCLKHFVQGQCMILLVKFKFVFIDWNKVTFMLERWFFNYIYHYNKNNLKKHCTFYCIVLIIVNIEITFL